MRKMEKNEKDKIRHFLKVMYQPEVFNNYSYDDAIKFVGFAIKLRPNEPFLYFIMASYYSELNRINKSLFYYDEALKRGYRDWNTINRDLSFGKARQTEKFKIITSRYM